MGTECYEVYTDSDYPLHCKLVGGPISRREYFAAMVMCGLVTTESQYPPVKETAAKAVRYADALLEELDREPKP